MRRVVGAVHLRERARLRLLGVGRDRPARWGHGLETALFGEIRRPPVAQAPCLGFGAAASSFPPVQLVVAHF